MQYFYLTFVFCFLSLIAALILLEVLLRFPDFVRFFTSTVLLFVLGVCDLWWRRGKMMS